MKLNNKYMNLIDPPTDIYNENPDKSIDDSDTPIDNIDDDRIKQPM